MDSPAPDARATRACTICKRSDRRDVERAMASKHPIAVAAEFGLDERTVRRHERHLTSHAAVAIRGEELSHAAMVVQTLRDCMDDARRIQAQAEEGVLVQTKDGGTDCIPDLALALKAIRERTRIGETWAKLTLAATLAKVGPQGPGAPPWDKLSTPERIAKCDETIGYFQAWKQRLEAQELLASGGQFARGIAVKTVMEDESPESQEGDS